MRQALGAAAALAAGCGLAAAAHGHAAGAPAHDGAVHAPAQDRAVHEPPSQPGAAPPEPGTSAARAAPRVRLRLDDHRQPLPHGRIAWRTDWVMCWHAVPGAAAYELQAVTGEGASRRLLRQSGLCRTLEVARGENAAGAGLQHRELMLAMQSGQLAYRVRAVYADGSPGAWSAPHAVGTADAAPR